MVADTELLRLMRPVHWLCQARLLKLRQSCCGSRLCNTLPPKLSSDTIAALRPPAAHIGPGQAKAVAMLLQAIPFLTAAEAWPLDIAHAHMLRRSACCCRLHKLLPPS